MFSPMQLSMTANAEINGESFSVTGVGVVRSPGVYEATLNFSALPKDFPPGLLATFLTSACCNSGASERAGSLNLGHTGVTKYTAQRTVTSNDGGSIDMTAKATLNGNKVVIHADIKGRLIAPYTPNNHAIYYITASPQNAGKAIVGVGEGSIFDGNGVEEFWPDQLGVWRAGQHNGDGADLSLFPPQAFSLATGVF